MNDKSYLDKKYFIDNNVFNCPFCNRRNVNYYIEAHVQFDWSNDKVCHIYTAKCSSCNNTSMHLTYSSIDLIRVTNTKGYFSHRFSVDEDLDSLFFYSIPTSFFVMDDKIPSIIRELISEAEGCLKMNYLTGASACMRKAIYELLIIEKVDGQDYENKIKQLKKKYADSDPALFDILAHIQDMTSDKIHEQSWDLWNSQYLNLIIETLKTVLHDVYVLPKIKKERSSSIQKLLEKVNASKKGSKPEV
ncbi:MAG: hypothetical protein Q7U71_04355 [bacterium]|nr:hypothetical protein [bacterium]